MTKMCFEAVQKTMNSLRKCGHAMRCVALPGYFIRSQTERVTYNTKFLPKVAFSCSYSGNVNTKLYWESLSDLAPAPTLLQ